jgi:hypothetical protein
MVGAVFVQRPHQRFMLNGVLKHPTAACLSACLPACLPACQPAYVTRLGNALNCPYHSYEFAPVGHTLHGGTWCCCQPSLYPTISLSLYLPLSLYLSFSPSLSLFLSLSLSLSLSLFLSLYPTLSLSFSLNCSQSASKPERVVLYPVGARLPNDPNIYYLSLMFNMFLISAP